MDWKERIEKIRLAASQVPEEERARRAEMERNKIAADEKEKRRSR
jgi:hypothetical protein